jgi:hypothetical protein
MDETTTDRRDDWEIRAVDGSHDADIHSPATVERIARIYSRASWHKNAPSDETALRHAALIRAAPRLRESLETILGGHEEQLDPTMTAAARALLIEINAGPGEAFFKERAEQERQYEEYVQAHILEMSMQSDVQKPSELEEDEEPGHSF